MNKLFSGITKKISILVLGAALILTGCTPGGTGTPTPTPSQQIVLIWWNLWEPEANVKPLIDAYQTLHPNVTIQYSQQGKTGGEDEYKTALDTALTDNDPLTTPDIFTIHNTWTDKYQNYIAPAPSSIVSENDLSDFYPVVKSDFFRSAVMALPLYLDTLAIIYNKDMLAAKGDTVPAEQWSDFKVQAQALTKRSGGSITVSGFSADIPDNSEFLFDVINLLFLQNGVKMTDVTSTKAIFSTQRGAKDAVDFYQSFKNNSNGTWDANFKKDVAAFLEKKLAMYPATSWRLINLLQYNSTYNLGLNIGVAPMPQISGETVHWATYWGQTVARDSTHQDVAWDFIKFITQAEQLRILGKTVADNGRPFGIIFPRASMASENSADPYLGPYALSAARAQSWNMKDGYAMKKQFLQSFQGDVDVASLESAATKIMQEKPLSITPTAGQ